MKQLNLKAIIEQIGGTVIQGSDEVLVDSFVTRLKGLRPGAMLFDLFHVKAGEIAVDWPCAIVTDRPENFGPVSDNVTIVKVDNIDEACWRFVEYYRGLFKIPVIGVTGTCGKTTTKEMIKHILSQRYKVAATYKSYNAQARHLSYLLGIDDSIQAAVFEMGVAAPSDLKTSCRIFKPQVGVITNIGVDHLSAFSSLDSYIRAKAEMLSGVGDSGTVILNCDDTNTKKINLRSFKGKVLYFGTSSRADFRILQIKPCENGINFLLQYKNKVYYFFIPEVGEFNVYNAAAAIAAAHCVGFSVKEAGEALATFKNVERHFELKKGINGSTIIDDTWSANPTSSAIAVKLLKQHAKGKKTVAIFGKMALLGRHSDKYHYKLGAIIAQTGINKLVLIGDDASEIGYGAIDRGMDKENVLFCKDSDEAFAALQSILDENSVALVKTSMILPHSDLISKLEVRSEGE